MKKHILFFSLALILLSCMSTPTTSDKVFLSISDALDFASKSLLDHYLKGTEAESKIKRIAVLPIINDNGNKSNLGILVSDGLQTRIFDRSVFNIIERERIDSILEEHEFSRSGLVDSDYVKELGRILGADMALIGTIHNNGETFRLNAKIVDIENGELLSTTEVSFLSDDNLKIKYDEIIDFKRSRIDGAYSISINEIVVRVRSASNWDSASEPDIFIKISVNDRHLITSDVTSDKYINNKLVTTDVILKANDIIRIKVYDSDIMSDDLIGKIELTPLDINRLIQTQEYIDFSKDYIEKISIKINRL